MEARELEALLARVESATGPDREIDAALVKVMCRGALVAQYFASDEEPSVFHAQALGLTDRSDVPPYTASLDAALALVERVLPEQHWRVERTCEYRALAFRIHRFTAFCGYGPTVRAEGPTPALALLIALLRAKAKDAQQERSPQAHVAQETQPQE